jgi:hypothetical protein
VVLVFEGGRSGREIEDLTDINWGGGHRQPSLVEQPPAAWRCQCAYVDEVGASNTGSKMVQSTLQCTRCSAPRLGLTLQKL